MKVKRIFKSIQGEGYYTGMVAVFCRFSGCNLWSGRGEDRLRSVCQFCDTDFLGGESYGEVELVEAIVSAWGEGSNPFVVFTGGEPGLQLTKSLLDSLFGKGFRIAVETNGTTTLPEGEYWRTVSPKHGSTLKQTWGDELKVVWPQDLDLSQLKTLRFKHFYLQPMAGEPEALQQTLSTVLSDPSWRLSLQTHKFIGVE